MATSNDSSATPTASSSPSLLDNITANVAASGVANGVANNNTSAPASIAVVVTSGGDADLLDRSLDALTRQDLPALFDLVVVDEYPDPDRVAARMVAMWSARGAVHEAHRPNESGARLHHLPNSGEAQGAAAARNLGWRASGAAIIAFTSDDAVPAADWLRQGVKALGAGSGQLASDGDGAAGAANAAHHAADDAADPAHATLDAVCGRVDAVLPKHPTESQWREHQRAAGEFTGCNWFCRRALLERLGGFDERFTDTAGADADMHFRLLEAQVALSRAPAASVARPVPAAGWADSLAQLRALSGEALLYKKHPRLYREKIRSLPDWHDAVVVAALLLAATGIWLGHELLTVCAGGIWLVLTAMLCIRRLHDTAKTPSHVAAVLLTSFVLPPLALFWRLVGAVRHRVPYA